LTGTDPDDDDTVVFVGDGVGTVLVVVATGVDGLPTGGSESEDEHAYALPTTSARHTR
jgi:hypothetical protein